MIIPNPDAGHQADDATSADREQRRFPRTPRKMAVEFLNMGDDPHVPFYQDFVLGETEDVSEGGLRVRAAYDVYEGAELGIIVRTEDRFQVFLARVVWKIRESSGCLYGLSVPRLEPARLP